MSDQIKVELQSVYGTDKDIAHAAWTSSTDLASKELKTDQDVKRVIDMLADLGHSVPFESVIFRFWMRIPIATDRQIMTHRIASHSGMSGRYRTMPDEFLAIPSDVADILYKCIETFQFDYIRLCEESNKEYQKFVKRIRERRDKGKITSDEFKRAREFFRGMLPQHNMTERVSIMNLRSWANFQRLRNSPHAQPEIRLVAEKMLDLVINSSTIPLAVSALERNGWKI